MKNAWEALSDGTRREILSLLRSRPHTAGEISDQFSLSASTVSHHLGVLRESGLVLRTRRAQTLIYSLDEGAFKRLLTEINGFLQETRRGI